MEENFVLNGNKLIAEFIGLIKTNVEDLWSTVEYLTDNPKSNLPCTVPIDTTPCFHKSWECLMTVVEKIEQMGVSTSMHYFGGTKKQSFGYNCTFLGYAETVSVFENSNQHDNKKEATYKTVIKFIEWYNENNTSNKS